MNRAALSLDQSGSNPPWPASPLRTAVLPMTILLRSGPTLRQRNDDSGNAVGSPGAISWHAVGTAGQQPPSEKDAAEAANWLCPCEKVSIR